eukprot:SAG31_NODE_2767_length_5122_cov_7.978101_4_plen_68_part_00
MLCPRCCRQVENVSFEEVGEDQVKLTQAYDNHLLDDLGEIVPDSVTEGFTVTQVRASPSSRIVLSSC